MFECLCSRQRLRAGSQKAEKGQRARVKREAGRKHAVASIVCRPPSIVASAFVVRRPRSVVGSHSLQIRDERKQPLLRLVRQCRSVLADFEGLSVRHLRTGVAVKLDDVELDVEESKELQKTLIR